MIDFEKERRKMVNEQLRPRGIKDEKVLRAFETVPRHLFVRPKDEQIAYGDYPLLIGYGQTISQPYIVALMTQVLDLKQKDKVLEIGTGSGYQTAILAELAAEIYSVERIPELAERAKNILQKLGYNNITIRVSNGTIGWDKDILFDAIIVTAASPAIPPSLLNQLKEGGKMVIPIGNLDYQDLMFIIKSANRYIEKNLGECRFVPLRGTEGWDSLDL